MSNRSSSKKHGLSSIHITRKKSTISKRSNKAKATIRRVERHEKINSHYQTELKKL